MASIAVQASMPQMATLISNAISIARLPRFSFRFYLAEAISAYHGWYFEKFQTRVPCAAHTISNQPRDVRDGQMTPQQYGSIVVANRAGLPIGKISPTISSSSPN